MKTNLQVTIGKDEYDKDLTIDIAQIKNLLIAGNSGSGKSTLIHNFVSTLIFNNSPELLKLILIDPKHTELSIYNRIPHLLTPVVTEVKKAILATKWAGKEMDRRFELLKDLNVRNINEYHDKASQSKESMPYIVIVIDDIYSIMETYPREMETALVKLLPMAHIVGIHILLSTSKSNTKIVPKTIRDLINARIALQLSSTTDSKYIIGTTDANTLHGPGDLLFRDGMKYTIRAQAYDVSTAEVKKIVKVQIDTYKEDDGGKIDLQTTHTYTSDGKAIFEAGFGSEGDYDELYEQAKQIVVESGKASTSWLQRKLGIGYSRSAQLIDMLEEKGVVGPAKGSAAREVYGEKSSN
jgi:S-DNA-T family DNA segregation ATPase FtsK/SpoIIIE